MPQYDGSIRIGTGIDTSGIKKDSKQLEKELRDLANAQKSFLEAGGTKTSPVYKQYEKEVKSLQSALEFLKKTEEKQKKFPDVKKDEHWNTLKIDVEEYAKSLKELQDQGKFFGDEDYDQIYLAWKNAADAVKAYQAELNKKTESGQAKIAEQEAKAAERKEAAQRKAEEQAERALQKENARIQREIENQAKLEARETERRAKEEARINALQAKEEAKRAKEIAAIQAQEQEEERLDQIRINAVASNDQIIAKVERIKQLEQEVADLKTAGITEGYADYDSRIQELSALKRDVGEYRDSLSEIPEKFSLMRAAAQKAFHAVRSGLTTVENIGKKAFSGIFSMAKKAFSAIISGSKQSNVSLSGGFKTILRYGFGIRSIYALFNKIRSGIQEGFKNLMGYSDSFANSVQSVKNSMSTLGNQIAGAFRPIVEMVIPWLNSLISALTATMAKLAQFIAVLGGKSTFTKAKKIQDDYNKSLGGTAKAADKARGALAKFDDLDVLEKQKDASGGGAGDLDSFNDMFEEVEVDDKWKNIADWFREMWENSDFSALGKLLGEKLKESLENIDWNPIQETARKIGKSFATLINGFVEVEGLGESIGRTLAEAINTGFEFLNSFIHEIHADSIGKFLAEIINGILDFLDWDLIYDTFTTAAHKLAELINNFFSPENLDYEAISNAISNFFNTIIDSIYIFITETEWSEIGKNLGKTISDAWVGIDWAKAGETVGEAFKAFFDFISNAIEAVDWFAIGESVKEFLIGIDWAGVAASFFEFVGAAFSGFASFLVGLFGDGFITGSAMSGEALHEAAQMLFVGFSEGIINAFSEIAEFIKTNIFDPFMEGIRNAFGIHSPSTVMAEIGGYLIEGLKNGILNAWNSLKDTVGNVADGVVNTFKDILGIHSPSTVMDENGAYLIEGLKNGVSENMASVLELFNMLGLSIEDILTALNESTSLIVSEMLEMIYGKWEELLEQSNLSWTELSDLITKTLTIINTNILTALTATNVNWTTKWTQMLNTTKKLCSEIISAVSAMNNEVQAMCSAMIAAINAVKAAASSLGSVSVGGGSSGGAGARMASPISAQSFSAITRDLPHLASGSVIRGGNPFMAILGDQPAGQTNIETPAGLIKDMVREGIREEMGNFQIGGGQIKIAVQVNGADLAQVTLDDFLSEMNRQGYNVDLLGYT